MENRHIVGVLFGALLYFSILIPFILWVNGYFYPRVYIEQEVGVDSFTNNTYDVRSYLWVVYKGDRIIEKSYREYDVLCAEIPKIKEWHLAVLEEEKLKVLGVLESFENCEYR